MRSAKTVFFLVATLSLVSLSAAQDGVIILCAGDSITAASYPRHLHRLLSREGISSRVLNYGRNGYTSGEYLRFLRNKKAAMAQECPDFVLLQLGTNDVRIDGDKTPADVFARNLKAIIAIFREFRTRRGSRPQILLATIPPLPEKFSPPFGPESRERVTGEINPLLRKIAAEDSLVLVDNYSLFLNAPQLLPDIHPSREGYRRLAQNWHEALKPLLKRKKTNSLEEPTQKLPTGPVGRFYRISLNYFLNGAKIYPT